MNLATVHVAEALATSLSAEGHAERGRVGDNITVIGDMILEIPSDTVETPVPFLLGFELASCSQCSQLIGLCYQIQFPGTTLSIHDQSGKYTTWGSIHSYTTFPTHPSARPRDGDAEQDM